MKQDSDKLADKLIYGYQTNSEHAFHIVLKTAVQRFAKRKK